MKYFYCRKCNKGVVGEDNPDHGIHLIRLKEDLIKVDKSGKKYLICPIPTCAYKDYEIIFEKPIK